MRVAIIGAGVNGLYLAWQLQKAGNTVTIFEKREKIGKEACSGLFSEKLLKFIPEGEKLIQNKINFVLINFPKKTIKVKFAKKFLVISHAELDRLVASLAEAAGVKIILNNPISAIPKEFDRIIGCDGPYSKIRKNLGQKDPKMRLGIMGFLQKNDSSDFVETWATKNGFIWKIPRGQNIEYGIMEDPAVAKNIFDDFLKKYNLKLENMQAAPIPRGLSMPKNDKVAICGDAAGLVKPWSGGGVIWGLMGADLLLKNFPDFIKYQKEAKNSFYWKLGFSELATSLVYLFGFKIPWLIPSNFKIDGDFLKIFYVR